MAANFFRKIPKVAYNFKVGDEIETHEVKNISIKYSLSYDRNKRSSNIYKFAWLDDLRPDEFAEKYYGLSELYWLGLFSGGVYDIHNELPRNDRQLLEFNFLKYKADPNFGIWRVQNSKQLNEESVFEYMISTPGRVVDSNGDVLKEGLGTVARVVSTNNIPRNGIGTTIDGVNVQASDRVLLVAQTNQQENGLYIAKAGNWEKINQHNFVYIQQGTNFEDSIWNLDTVEAVTTYDNDGNPVVTYNPISFSIFPDRSEVVTLMSISENDNEAKRYVNIIENTFGPRFRAEYDAAMNKLQSDLEEEP